MTRKKPFAWSHSALGSFESCPRKHFRTRVKKDIYEGESAAMKDGKVMHKAFEDRMKHGRQLPPSLRHYEQICARMDKLPGTPYIEHKVALTRDLKVTGYFDKDVWVRVVLDYAHVHRHEGRIIDYKNGKRKPDSDQLMLFAAAGFEAFPEVNKFGTAFWWIKSKQTDRGEFIREKKDIIWREFEPRVERFEAAYETDDWPPRPSGLCKGWCPVRDCEYHEGRD